MDEPYGPRGLRRGEVIALCVVIPVVVALIIAAKPLVTDVLNRILHLSPPLVLTVVGLLVFGEAAVFFGFIFPGETAVILGGVVASGGHLNIWVLCALVVVAAIAGDTVGFWVGHRWGHRVLGLKLLSHRRGAIDKALDLLRRRGVVAVIIGRFTAFLRAVTPGLAGMSRMHYPRFLAANASGGIIWGTLFTLLGYWLGGAYHKAEKYAGWASTGLLLLLLAVAVGFFIRGRRSERRIEADFDGSEASSRARLEDDLEATRRSFEEHEA
jgi:membrane-associated protein